MRGHLSNLLRLKEAWLSADRLEASSTEYGRLVTWTSSSPRPKSKFSLTPPLYIGSRAFKIRLGVYCVEYSNDTLTRTLICNDGDSGTSEDKDTNKRQLWVWCPEGKHAVCERDGDVG
ncbi:hypothetical protein NECID01_1466 [Nematocida sp. AWRm77]|nr:hypothetical protein NECID01_1466 [Nematocida sp. AWRm77]